MSRRLPLLLSAHVVAIFALVANGIESPSLTRRFCIPAANVYLNVAAPPRTAFPATRPFGPGQHAACASRIPCREADLREVVGGGCELPWAEWIVPEDHYLHEKKARALGLPARDRDGPARPRRHRGAEGLVAGAAVAALSDSLLLSRPPPVRFAV